jgi:L-aspartate oxidase
MTHIGGDIFEGPRYLVAFGPKRVPHCFTDVLILGGGLAGLRAALAVDPRLSVTVVTKDDLRGSSSQWAQGGIAGVVDPEDRFDNHVADTLTAGGGLCHEDVVDAVIREAPTRINELIAWGTRFDARDGALELGREGGHSHHRIVHALGDATGREVMRAVIERARALDNLEVWPDTFTIDLVTHEGRCRGALVWNQAHGKTLVWAKQTILATGGVGQIYRESTNPPGASGDGMALAWRAGAEIRDMEFMQFHPTVLYIAGGARSLITEAVRGAGAWLVDRDGHRFMPDFDDRAELAPRDVVSRAITEVMHRTHHSNVYLDLSHLDPAMVRQRFPGMAEICGKFGLDLARDRIPVRPGAHYMIGGVTVDDHGRTSVPGLLAAGEVTSSGLHGANRLASNSLLEGLVYGARAGEAASAEVIAARGAEDRGMFHVAEGGGGTHRSEPGRSPRGCRRLVSLCVAAAVCRPDRLAAAEHAGGSATNDPRRARPRREPRCPLSKRPSRGRRPVADAHRLAARPRGAAARADFFSRAAAAAGHPALVWLGRLQVSYGYDLAN